MPPTADSHDDSSQLPPDVAIAVVMGTARPGTPVPDLDELVLRSGLPAIDVVAGLEALVDRRAVEMVPGTNRLVTRRISYHVDGSVPPSLTTVVRTSGSLRPGMRWRSLVRSAETQRANREIADRLAVTVGREVVRVIRDRLLGESVVGSSEEWLRTDIGTGVGREELVDALFEHGSLAEALAARHGSPLRRLSVDVALRVPPPAVGERFGPAAGELAWWMESINTVDGSTPAEFSQGWLRADHFRVILDAAQT